MAKEVAIGKRAKISEAQQLMLLSVLGASLFLGAAIKITLYFVDQITFNVRIIMAEDESIVSYSKAIMQTGICKKPAGEVYTDKELEECVPDAIDVSEIPGTLRANIMEGLASNESLGSVTRQNDESCINPEASPKRAYTYDELNEIYQDAKTKGKDELAKASALKKSCSALRVIPDALPAFKNEEALLASLNKIFKISNYNPSSLSPGGTTVSKVSGKGLNALSVRVTIENQPIEKIIGTLDNVERSIREFSFNDATIEWTSGGGLNVNARATAYYMDKTTLNEGSIVVPAKEGKL